MKEVWKDIKGYEGHYEVSNTGKVRSLKHNRKRMLRGSRREYVTVSLTIKQNPRTNQVHRLVAQAFIPNPNNLPLVNHKNKNKYDNRVENLEWCTSQENIVHARTHGNLVSLGTKEGRIASAMIPMVQRLVPFTTEFSCKNRQHAKPAKK